MLTTRGAEGLRGRPLEARPDRAGGVIWFLTDLRSTKGDEIAAEPDVGLVFIDADEKVYLSITARGYLVQDRVKAAAIWKTSDKMWWKGPDDPNVACCERRCQPQKCGMAQQAEPSPCSSL